MDCFFFSHLGFVLFPGLVSCANISFRLLLLSSALRFLHRQPFLLCLSFVHFIFFLSGRPPAVPRGRGCSDPDSDSRGALSWVFLPLLVHSFHAFPTSSGPRFCSHSTALARFDYTIRPPVCQVHTSPCASFIASHALTLFDVLCFGRTIRSILPMEGGGEATLEAQ